MPALIAVLAAGITAAVVLLIRSTAPDPFVTRQGTELKLGSRTLHFVGFNFSDAAGSSAYSCARTGPISDDELRRQLREAHEQAGATVVRFWAYQTYTRGGTDFSGVDRVLRIASEEGMLAMPVLEDGPGFCTYGTTGVPKNEIDGG